MPIMLGDTAPDFTAQTTEGELSFHQWLGESWGLLFSHPKDFTPVCTTELGEVAGLKTRLDKRGVKAIGVSIDSLEDHHAWSKDIEEVTGHALNFPLIADSEKTVANLYGMIHPNALDTLTVRSVFIIGPDRKVKLTANQSLATPANWQVGDRCIIAPSISDEEAQERFPGYETIKPYLRTTPCKG